MIFTNKMHNFLETKENQRYLKEIRFIMHELRSQSECQILSGFCGVCQVLDLILGKTVEPEFPMISTSRSKL